MLKSENVYGCLNTIMNSARYSIGDAMVHESHNTRVYIASFYNICLYRYMSHSSGIVYVCKRGTEISISYAVAHIFEVLFRECVHSRRPGANPVPGLWLGNTISIRTSI